MKKGYITKYIVPVVPRGWKINQPLNHNSLPIEAKKAWMINGTTPDAYFGDTLVIAFFSRVE